MTEPALLALLLVVGLLVVVLALAWWTCEKYHRHCAALVEVLMVHHLRTDERLSRLEQRLAATEAGHG